MAHEPKIIPIEERPDFRSMVKETWLDTDGVERTRYVLRQVTAGVQIIDTFNDANAVVKDNITTADEAAKYLRTTKAR